MPEPSGVVARPRATLFTCIGFAVVFTVVLVAVWAQLGADVHSRVTWFQWATLLVFLFFCDGFLLAIGSCYVRADATGLTYRNLIGTRHLDWAQIARLRFADGDPFAYAYLVDGDPSGRERVQLLGIQQTDGRRARELFARLEAQRPSTSGSAG